MSRIIFRPPGRVPEIPHLGGGEIFGEIDPDDLAIALIECLNNNARLYV